MKLLHWKQAKTMIYNFFTYQPPGYPPPPPHAILLSLRSHNAQTMNYGYAPIVFQLTYHKLSLFHAPKKSKFLITILINNKAIDEVKYTKYLGVTLDAQLSFKYHIDELTKKISR